MKREVILCVNCKHCFKSRRSRTGYACEVWGRDDFACDVPLDGWCFKADHKVYLRRPKND